MVDGETHRMLRQSDVTARRALALQGSLWFLTPPFSISSSGYLMVYV